MHTHNARRARGEHLFDTPGVEVVGYRVDIAKHRRDPLPLEGVCRGDERPGRNDDLTGETGGLYCDLQRYCGVARGYAVLDTEQFRELSLELLHVGTVVGQPPAIQRTADAFKQAFGTTDVGATDVQDFLEGRRTTHYRQFFCAVFVRHPV